VYVYGLKYVTIILNPKAYNLNYKSNVNIKFMSVHKNFQKLLLEFHIKIKDCRFKIKIQHGFIEIPNQRLLFFFFFEF